MPMTVRNNEENTTVFTKTLQGDHVKIVWGTRGESTDTQRVPDAAADDIDFLNSIDQGIFTVVSASPEIMQKINEQAKENHKFREEQVARQKASTESVMNRTQDASMIGLNCIGPGFRSGSTCDRPVLVPSKKQSEVPPLCEEHSPLASTFHLVEQGSKGDAETGASQSREGVVRREWKQAVVGERQRSL